MKTTQAIVPYFNLARILWALVTLAAIVATYSDTASRGPVQPMNFFWIFHHTVQCTIGCSVDCCRDSWTGESGTGD